jgi:hypothetical protein
LNTAINNLSGEYVAIVTPLDLITKPENDVDIN